MAELNQLWDSINAAYGYLDSDPRINRGPCGRFAKAFREQWNARFRNPVHIAFVMSRKSPECFHVLVNLPDGNYDDGGNGVMSAKELLKLYPDGYIDVMVNFDFKVLDKRSYGLGRTYPNCPNYSDEITAKLIALHLARLPSDLFQP